MPKTKSAKIQNNTISESGRYRVTINGHALNTILKSISPGIRSSIIQIALSQWLNTMSAKATLRLMGIKGLRFDRETNKKRIKTKTDKKTDVKSMLEESTGDF